MLDRIYADYAWEQTAALLAIDSPSGYTAAAAKWVQEAFAGLGFDAKITVKGGVIVDFGGEDKDDALFLEAHADTLGAMVAQVKGDGRLKLTSLGGMNPNNAEAENVRVHTRDGKVIEGTFQLCNPSKHCNAAYSDINRNWDTCEVVLDEDVNSVEDVRALGIEVGDIVCFDPRTRRTASGYLKSRFLDDKLSVGILLGLAKYIADGKITPKRRVWGHITVYEEVGHGAAAISHMDVEDLLAVDMGCVGDDLNCREAQVSICAKDSGGPYDWSFTNELIARCKNNGIDYAVDIYPGYGSDCGAALRAGMEIRFALCGQGVFASHGYERTHIDGIMGTLKLVMDVAEKC